MQATVLPNKTKSAWLVLSFWLLMATGCQAPVRTTSTETATEQGTAINQGAATDQETATGQTGTAAEETAALTGAWRLVQTTDPDRQAPDVVKIVSNRHFTFANYDQAQKRFLGAGGGTWSTGQGRYTENYEYFTQDSTKVGSSVTYSLDLGGNTLRLAGTRDGRQVEETWERIDEGESPLAGAWRIRERETEPGQMSTMQRGPRKTIKWLSGNRFQWAAINTETKQFFGTGGGTYTLADGKYTEHIEFFSRDPSRVGMSVSFDYEVKDGDWHHSGKSTAGNPIYEVWALED